RSSSAACPVERSGTWVLDTMPIHSSSRARRRQYGAVPTATRRAAYRSCMRRARGDTHVSVKDESYDWRTLALGIASLLTQMPEQTHQEDMLNVVARQLKAPVATLRAHAARLESQVDGQHQG